MAKGKPRLQTEYRMRHARRAACLMAVAMLAASPAGVWAQVESHMLGPEMPLHPMPGWVLAPPPFWSRQLAPVRPEGIPAPTQASRNPLTMPDDARRAIRLAQAKQWADAAKVGLAVLKRPATDVNAYSREYVANATAWALIQLGNRERARQVHVAVAQQMADPAVARYHRLAAGMLKTSRKRTEDLRNVTVYLAELRKQLGPHYKEFAKYGKMAGQSETLEGQLGQLSRAYGQLRFIYAADAELGRKLLKEKYRPAVDGLLETLVPHALKQAREIRDTLNRAYKQVMEASSFPEWNDTVRQLWAKVRLVKQICRIHYHLATTGLATPGRARGPFEEAHRLLFCQGAGGLVWQPVGYARIVNGIAQIDIRRRVAWQETTITPHGASDAEHTNQSNQGWKRMGEMQRMDGDAWEKMDGDGWNKMDGNGWNKMDGDGWNKMDGNGWNKMDGNGWNKMKGDGWNR